MNRAVIFSCAILQSMAWVEKDAPAPVNVQFLFNFDSEPTAFANVRDDFVGSIAESVGE
jgi:hypothetical protein